MRKNFFIVVWFVILLAAEVVSAQVQPYYVYDTDLMSPSVFKARREKVMKEMTEGSVAFFYSGPEHVRSNDVEYFYHQNENFYYLTGNNEPNSIIVLLPAGIEVSQPSDTSKKMIVNEILFVQPRDIERETWIGRRLGPEGAMKIIGFQYALNNDQFKPWISKILIRAKVAYVPNFPHDFAGEIAELTKPLRDVMATMNSRIEFRDPTPMVVRMRAVKSPEEIAMIQKAVDISVDAHKQAMISAEPRMHEYELQAIFEYVFRREGAESIAYPCIVGSAENSVILHYSSDRRQMKDGDVVLMDCAAEYHNYSADVTRTIPVNGRFTDAQREIYEIVLQAQEEAMKQIKPDADYRRDVHGKAVEIIQNGLLKLGIIKDKNDYRKFFMHGTGHPVGLYVHDVGGSGPLQPGMVWTVEPGIYIPEGAPGVDPKYYNIGVRIEDCVLVTQDGYKLMSGGAPRTVKEIEQLMKKRGIGNEVIRE